MPSADSSQLGQLLLPEAAVRQLAVRDVEIRIVHGLPVEADDVEIERARTPTHVTRSPFEGFDLEQPEEELVRREGSFERDHLVEIAGLILGAERFRFVNRRLGEDSAM